MRLVKLNSCKGFHVSFRKNLTKCIKTEQNFTYKIYNTKGLRLLKRLWLGLSYLGDHIQTQL